NNIGVAVSQGDLPYGNLAASALRRKYQRYNPDDVTDTQPHNAIVAAEGHLIDSQLLNAIFDTVIERGGAFEVLHFEIGRTNQDFSRLTLKVSTPSAPALATLLETLIPLGCHVHGERRVVGTARRSERRENRADDARYEGARTPARVRRRTCGRAHGWRDLFHAADSKWIRRRAPRRQCARRARCGAGALRH